MQAAVTGLSDQLDVWGAAPGDRLVAMGRSVLGELEAGLLQWSRNQAAWKQDLLRRLAGSELIGADAIRAYADAAERIELERDAPWYNKPTLGIQPAFEPLDSAHLTATDAGSDPVTLVKVIHIHGANGLANGASLEFNPLGLTIIAGRNGSGKSGYTRILKQVAASRAAEDVLPNAFDVSQTPKAILTYRVGKSSHQELTWEAGSGRIESPLQRVRVFDARAAGVQLADSTQVAYIPSTLQILGAYTGVLRQVEALISDDLEEAHLKSRGWPALEISVGRQILQRLGETDTLVTLRQLAALTPGEETELTNIGVRLRDLEASNPADLEIQARQRADQLTRLARSLGLIAAKLSPAAIAKSEELRITLAAAQTAAEEAQALVTTEGTLPGTGSDSWQQMWNAASRFVHAHHGHPFPDDSSDAVCPLCQQALDTTARIRFTKFAQFMSGEAQTALQAARTLRETDLVALSELPVESSLTAPLVDLVGTYDGKVAASLMPALGEARRICDYLAGFSVDADFDPETLANTFAVAIETLQGAAAGETARAEALAATDSSADAAAQLTARRDELSVRRDLVANLAAIAAQHDLTIRGKRLEASKSACSTTSASKKNSELSSNYVTKMCQTFEDETLCLGLEHVPVQLIFDHSSRGVSYIKVVLKGAQDTPVTLVLSEGEQRVAAIAGFFADLTESGDPSTLVFDDPVSSLDHEYRVKIARRLLKEAENRQVLVFTHDFSFVQYLYEEKALKDLRAKAAGHEPAPDINYLHIERIAAGTGVQTDGKEWREVPVKERIGRIKQRIQDSAVLYRNNDMTRYGSEARDIAGAIRETWEVLVEEVLLNRVVTRHERQIQTKRLRDLTDLTDTDIAAVELGMSVESRYMTGHASPLSDGSLPISPEELSDEVKSLEELRLNVIHRREKPRKGGSVTARVVPRG